jgi:hypothetical protein
MWHNEKVAHRVEYRLSALLSRVGRLFQLFQPINEQIEEFGLLNPTEITDLTFKHRHRHARRTLVERRETSNGHGSGQSGSTGSGRSGSSQ